MGIECPIWERLKRLCCILYKCSQTTVQIYVPAEQKVMLFGSQASLPKRTANVSLPMNGMEAKESPGGLLLEPFLSSSLLICTSRRASLGNQQVVSEPVSWSLTAKM